MGLNDLVNQYRGYNYLSVMPVSDEITMQAVQLRSQYNMQSMDALHLATAIEQNCSAFISHDKVFQQVKEIPIPNF